MPGVARVGVDRAGGIITGAEQDSVYANGALIAIPPAAVAPHGQPPHNAAVMVGKSSTCVCRRDRHLPRG